MQIAACEGPLERFGGPLVADLERHHVPLQLGQTLEIARGEQLTLNDGEIDLDLVEPTGVNWRMEPERCWAIWREGGRRRVDHKPGEASSPGYRHALERQHAMADLPYRLEVWHGAKVLSILWADDGRCEVASFIRGPWEDLALAL